MWRFFYTLYLQQGATWEMPQGGTVQYDEAAAVTSLEFLRSLLDDTIATPSGDGGTAIAEFAGGQSGALFTGVWEVPTMRNAGLPFGGATVPNIYGTPAAYADSHAFVLPQQDSPGESRRAAYTFVANMLKDSFAWAQAGHIPSYNPVIESAEYQDLVPQSHYADAAEVINYDPEAWFTGSGSNFQNYFGDNIQNVLAGRTSPQEGIRGFVERINTLLAKPAPI